MRGNSAVQPGIGPTRFGNRLSIRRPSLIAPPRWYPLFGLARRAAQLRPTGMPPIEAWEEAIARPSTGGSINTVSAARGPMCLGLPYRCLYPGWHRRRGIAFRRAELWTAEETGRLNPAPCAAFATPSRIATVTTAQSDVSSVYGLRFTAINRDTMPLALRIN